MGKVKKMRQKLHNAAQRAKKVEVNSGPSMDEDMAEVSSINPVVPLDPTASGFRGDNLFSNLKISSSHLAQKLPDFDARSSITSKTFKGMNLTKKEKQKLRHEAWMSKIDHIQTAKKKAAETKRKQRTPIVGDLTPIHDALPTLELLMKKSTSSDRKEDKKSKPTLKEKARQKQMLDGISLFQQVLQHPLFKENEKTTITEHLKIAMQRQAANPRN